MIYQYHIDFHSSRDQTPWHIAYALYAELMQAAQRADAAAIHEAPGLRPLSQYVEQSQPQALRWTVNLMGEQTADRLDEALHAIDQVKAWGLVELNRKNIQCRQISLTDLQAQCLGDECRPLQLQLITPCSFRSEGSYVDFPSVRLIIRSLATRWSHCFDQLPLNDEDALRLLCEGIRIGNYHLKSASYRMKDTHIPGFRGELCLIPRLSPPMQQLYKLLMAFAPYSGLGIKTALGMGGVKLSAPFDAPSPREAVKKPLQNQP